MVSRYLANLRHDLSSEGLRSQRKFVDCTRDATAPDSRDQFPEPPQHDVQEPLVEQQAEQQQQVEQQQQQVEQPPGAMEAEGVEEARTRSAEEHPEAPPASRVRVQENQHGQMPFRGAETLTRQPRNWWTEIWIDSTTGETVGVEDIKKGVVIPEQLPAHLRDLFVLGSRLKEEKMVLESLRPLTEEAALEVEKTCPDRILPSRWLDVWKVKDEANKYPEAYGVCADHKLKVEVADFVAAFCQTNMALKENQRTTKLYARLPPQRFVSLPGVRVVELLGEIYGLSSAPQAWRNTILSFFKEMGMKIHPMAASVFVLFEPMKVDKFGRLHSVDSSLDCPVIEHRMGGIILLQVDDMLLAGNGIKFKGVLKSMQERFKFGRWDQLSEEREFNGRNLQQVDLDRFTVDMIKAVHKLKPLTIPPSRSRPATSSATADEVTAYRGLLGSMMWCSRCACPQGLAACSILAARTSSLKVQDMKDINAELLRLQNTVGKISIIGFAPVDSGYTLFSDA
eukprot:6492233-Amphidinium_carterae.1